MSKSDETSLLEYILFSFLPFTEENLTLSYNPRKFFYEIDKKIEKSKRTYTKNAISAAIYRAKKGGYLKEVELDNQERGLQLTAKGQLKIYKHISKENEGWDGKWRIIFFDIPEKYKTKRNFFRQKLKELGFKQYQLSAWISPYDYTKELDILIEELDIEKHVQYIIGESIKGKERFKELFGVKIIKH